MDTTEANNAASVNAYEQARSDRIAHNSERLAQLGLADALRQPSKTIRAARKAATVNPQTAIRRSQRQRGLPTESVPVEPVARSRSACLKAVLYLHQLYPVSGVSVPTECMLSQGAYQTQEQAGCFP